jgi:hypothetical protein
MTDPNTEREPSAAEGEAAEPDQIKEDEPAEDEPDSAVYGSEGGGGDTSPAQPYERKRKA